MKTKKWIALIIVVVLMVVSFHSCKTAAVVAALVFGDTTWQLRKAGPTWLVLGVLVFLVSGMFTMDGTDQGNALLKARQQGAGANGRHFISGGTWDFNQDTKTMTIHYTWYQNDGEDRVDYDGDTFVGVMNDTKGEFVLQSQTSNDVTLTLTRN